MALQEKVEEYFSSLNSMANRICVDLKDTKCSYKHLWETFPYEVQDQILNESIIKPDVLDKYPQQNNYKEKQENYAIKMVVDDSCTYRDEHSGPFCFRTNSQRDLTLFPPKSPKEKDIKNIAPRILKLPVASLKEAEMEIEESFEVDVDEVDSTSLTKILPKTGLDLLDNW